MPTFTTSDSSSRLVARLRARDAVAWDNFVRLYGPLVLHWARQAGLQEADASDVTQQVFLEVAAHIERFQHDQPNDTFHGWLWTIARNKLTDLARRAANRPEAVGGSTFHQWLQELPADAPAAETARAELVGLTQRALSLIRTDFHQSTWRAFWGTVVDGRSAAAVAEELQISIGAVYAARSRVLLRLRSELADPLS